MEKREELCRIAVACRGDWKKISEALKFGKKYEAAVTEPYITIFDDAYPMELRALRHPPWVLFYRGDITLLNRPKITVVGARKASAYGLEMTETCVRALAQSFALVSGLALGVDACVHRTAIENGALTIGVIGSGLDHVYPVANFRLYDEMKKKHLILSEYPAGTGVRKEHFPWRNRILAALGQEVIVTEAAERSGTMITVNEALALSKEVWCVPQRAFDPSGAGCNLLISQGAQVLYSAEQLKEIRPRIMGLAFSDGFRIS